MSDKDHALASYPQPVWYNTDPDSYRSDRVDFYPYTTLMWQNAVTKFGLKIPFQKIIDKADGISTCKICGCIYAGHELSCKKERYRLPNDGYYLKTTKPGFVQCGGSTNWDKADEFRKQKEFFALANWLGSCPEYDNSWFKDLKDFLPAGSADVLEKRMMIQKIETLEANLESCRFAIEEMARKMNAAGGALSF